MKNNYNQNSMKNINSENINIEKILIKQIELGNDEDYGAFYEYNEEDLSALVSIEDTMLKNNGYKILTEDKFSQKIKNIFGRIIDYNSSTKFLKIETFEGAKCDFKLEYYPYGADAQYIYVDKTNKFITNFFPLPRILDYVKLYPQVMKYEEKDLIIDDKIEDIQVKASQWKDEENLSQQRHFNQQLLINRNKYLFNDNKASLAWLKVNDEYFLESLVTTFGYTKDKNLLDWVMQRNRSKAVEFINNNVFVRNCKGELEIREDILKYIEQKTTDEENTHDYAKALYHYEVYENPNKWTEKEAYKILAYKSNTYDYLFMKYKNIRYNNRWNILGSIYYYSNRGDEKEWKEIEKNFEKNNYYNLPHLKEALEYAYIFE